MRQAIMTKPGKLRFNDVPEPSFGSNEVLLRIKQIGICGSDIHVYHGKHPFTTYPVIQGHEYCGIVEAVGEKTEHIKPGMLATARPQLVCWKCRPCKKGDYNICENLRVQGFQAPGCAQDFFVVTKDRIVVLPDSMSFEQGALIEPASVGCHSTTLAGDFKDKNVVVMGAGLIGNFIGQIAQNRGADKVLIVDLSEYRLQVAQQCGIENVSNAKVESLNQAIQRVFGDKGFQIALEATAAEECLSAVIGGIEKGGTIITVGVFEQPPKVDMSTVCEHQISILGSMMYKHEDYLEAVEMVAGGKIKTEPLVTKHFPFEQYLEAYRFIEKQRDKIMKVMIDL